MFSGQEKSTPETQIGGYVCEFVSPPKEIQFECSICLHIVKEPRLVSCCGYRFCSDCILRVERDRNPCPLCNESFTTLPDKLLERTLKQKLVTCTYDDCSWIGDLAGFEAHLRECVNCPIKCPQKCGGSFPRSSMAAHISQDCPETVVECEFSNSGCHTKLPRKSIAEHMKSSAQDHVTLLSGELTDLKVRQDQVDSDAARLLDDIFISQEHSSPISEENFHTFEATSTKVLVRGLPTTADEQKLKCVFGQAGRVIDINFFPSLHVATIDFLMVSSVTNLFKKHYQRPFRLHSHVFDIVQLGGT